MKVRKDGIYLLKDSFIRVSRLDGQNIELEAIRALQYEGTPAEIAQSFKEQGNDMTKVKKWKDAREFYTKGIAVLSQKKTSPAAREGVSDEQWTSDEKVEELKESGIEEACYVNRALCNLELSILVDPL